MRIDADARAGGKIQIAHAADGGTKPAFGVFGVNAALDRCADAARASIRDGLTGRDSQLLGDQIASPKRSSVTGCSTCRRVLTSRK